MAFFLQFHEFLGNQKLPDMSNHRNRIMHIIIGNNISNRLMIMMHENKQNVDSLNNQKFRF